MNTRPPRLALWLLAQVLRRDEREAIVGDLWETHARDSRERGAVVAWWRCWFDVLRSLGPLLHHARGSSPLATAAVVLVTAAVFAGPARLGPPFLVIPLFAAAGALLAIQLARSGPQTTAARWWFALRATYLLFLVCAFVEFLHHAPGPLSPRRLALALVMPLLVATPVALVVAFFGRPRVVRLLALVLAPHGVLLLLLATRMMGSDWLVVRTAVAVGLPFTGGWGDPSWRGWNLALDCLLWLVVAVGARWLRRPTLTGA